MIGIEEAKSEVTSLAIGLYKDGKVGLSKAAEIAGLSIAEFEGQLIKEGIGIILYTKDDLTLFKSEVENIKEIAKKSRKP